MKYKTDDRGYYVTYTLEDFIIEGCPEDIPVGLFKMDVKDYK